MIDGPSREPHPGRLPPLYQQWSRIGLGRRIAVVGVPAVIVLVVFLMSVPAGVAVGVMVVGAAGATLTYVKNRTDRHNAAIERGDILDGEGPPTG